MPGSHSEDKTLLQCSQRYHKGEFRQVSISSRQRSLRCGQNLRGPFLRATLPMTVGSCARAMADNGKTKGLITPPPKLVSTQLLYVCDSADSDHDGVARIFVALFCELWSYLFTVINYITQVATALLVAGSTLTFWIPWQTPFASTSSSYSTVVQSAKLLV